MVREFRRRRFPRPRLAAAGFSIVELLVSVVIITLLMSAVFSFMFQTQKRFQSNIVISESNQSARAALELMTQEIGQAGYNPHFFPNKTSSALVVANADPQCVTITNLNQINKGDWVQIDTGTNSEIVQVVGVTGNPPGSPYDPVCATPGANQIYAVFQSNHDGTATAFPIVSYKMPFPTGILQGSGTSDGHTLEFYGDINSDGTINYVVYSLAPTTSPATTVTVSGTAYTLYNLRRSITPVTFAASAANNKSSPLVQNVMYDLANERGPTGLPLFSYPTTVPVGVVPNVVTVVGTIVITTSVAVNPRSLESGRIEWYTMATQIRPLNLSSSVAINNAGGVKYMAKLPAGLPMTYPTGY